MKNPFKMLIFFGTVGLLAFGCNRSPENVANKIVEKISDKLELNESQVQKLEKIKVAALDDHKKRKANANANDHAETVQKFILSDNLEREDVKTVIDEKKGKFDKMFDKYFPLVQDFHKSLNAEQKQKLAKLAKKMHKKRRRHWH